FNVTPPSHISILSLHDALPISVLCYSRMLFFQINPTFQRFDCKVFLTDALRYAGGAPQRVMIDNTHVVVLRGTGREMIPVPEMEDRKSTRLNSSHVSISYAVFC